MEYMFRLLRADEIECRIAMCKPSGVQLLLYKDARCDQNILDETVGPMNWQRHHSRDNANCIVSLWDDTKKQWIEKEDTGTESNTEAAKGLASDSFKRACFNWGIGRELYTSPFIWFDPASINLSNGKCYDSFRVTDIEYDGRTIKSVTIEDVKTKVSKTFGKPAAASTKKKATKAAAKAEEPTEDAGPVKVSAAMIKVLEKELASIGRDITLLRKFYDIKELSDMTVPQFNDAMKRFEATHKAMEVDKNE